MDARRRPREPRERARRAPDLPEQGLERAMRSSGGCDQDGPAKVASVEPQDGESQVLRDAPIVVRLSQPLDPASVTDTSLWVQDPEGPVPGELHLSPDGQVVIWGGTRPLRPGALHFL